MVKKKVGEVNTREKWSWIEANHHDLSISSQCRLLGLNRSLYYLTDGPEESSYNLYLMNLLDQEHTKHPFYGSRRLTVWLCNQGHSINRKRVQRLMKQMGIEAIYPRKNLSKENHNHKKFPYLLKGLEIAAPNYVWSTDITYIRLLNGFAYCVAIIDWFSRYVIAWQISNTLDTIFCLEALDNALQMGKPYIFNTDQGAQFTSSDFVGRLEKESIKISMDGRGRALDNIFVERLWRSLKYENIYLSDYQSVKEARIGIGEYFKFYNDERPHQSLGYHTPKELHFA